MMERGWGVCGWQTDRGQAAGAAVLVAVIAGLLIMFIIMIPPSERAELLGEPTANDSKGSAGTLGGVVANLLLQSPGRIDYLVQKEIEHPLPVVNIRTSEEATIISEKSVVSSKRGLFSEKSSEFSFSVANTDDVKNSLLTFRVAEQVGEIHILLNGEEIYTGSARGGQLKPIVIPQGLIRSSNLIVFKLSSPGVVFWRTNSFVAENVKVVADTINREAQRARQVFLVSETEKDNLERVILKFHPECRYGEAGVLRVLLNGREVYSATPDCDVAMVPIEISPRDLVAGENYVEFGTSRGAYLLSSVNVVSKLKEIDYPAYYFEISQEQYNDVKSGKLALKIRLAFVDVTTVRAGELIYNGVVRNFETRDSIVTIDAGSDVERGMNSVKIKPRRSLEVREIRADLIKP